MSTAAERPIVMAVTGASGAPYAVRLLETLIEREQRVSLIVSDHGLRLLDTELDIGSVAALRDRVGGAKWDKAVRVFDDRDRGAAPRRQAAGLGRGRADHPDARRRRDARGSRPVPGRQARGQGRRPRGEVLTPLAISRPARRFSADRIEIVSGYRSPKYNLMLRKKGHQVARQSQHTEGHAVDFRIPGVPTQTLLGYVRSLRLGGVGFYPHSRFVHSDTGRVRFWKGS